MTAPTPPPPPADRGRGARTLRGLLAAAALLAGGTVSAIAIGKALRPAPRIPAGLAERPSHVTMELRGVPDGARVIDARTRQLVGAAPRIDVPYDPTARLELEVEVPGRAPTTLRVFPDRDQVITVPPR